MNCLWETHLGVEEKNDIMRMGSLHGERVYLDVAFCG